MGVGHLFRCKTLANQFTFRGHSIFFAGRGLTTIELPATINIVTLSKSNMSIVKSDTSTWLGVTPEADIKECGAILAELQIDLLVIDHYAISSVWEEGVGQYYSNGVMVIDDLEREHYCDIILDYSLRSTPPEYKSKKAGTKLLMGPTYCLLNPLFKEKRPTITADPVVVKHILVSFGGSDLHKQTLHTVELISGFVDLFPDLQKISLVYGHLATAPSDFPTPKDIQLCVYQGLQQSELVDLLCTVDVVIGGAGVSSYEWCCLGVPSIIITVADNQLNNAKSLSHAGAAIYVGDHSVDDSVISQRLKAALIGGELLDKIRQEGLKLVDGQGPLRVVQICERIKNTSQ